MIFAEVFSANFRECEKIFAEPLTDYVKNWAILSVMTSA